MDMNTIIRMEVTERTINAYIYARAFVRLTIVSRYVLKCGLDQKDCSIKVSLIGEIVSLR